MHVFYYGIYLTFWLPLIVLLLLSLICDQYIAVHYSFSSPRCPTNEYNSSSTTIALYDGSIALSTSTIALYDVSIGSFSSAYPTPLSTNLTNKNPVHNVRHEKQLGFNHLTTLFIRVEASLNTYLYFPGKVANSSSTLWKSPTSTL